VTGTQWVEEFARALGLEPPDPTTVEALLRLASTAAHASERLAAPLACYLVGLAGAAPATGAALAEELTG